MVEIKNVYYKYKNGSQALSNINLTIQDGDFVAIIGRNGSRKIYSWKANFWFGYT